MRRVLAIAVAALLLAYSPIDAFARGGGHGGHSSSSGHLSGTGHVNPSSHSTHGYTRRNGTYVHPYHATNPNGTKRDNYSTKGNVNPWTGVPGHRYVDR